NRMVAPVRRASAAGKARAVRTPVRTRGRRSLVAGLGPEHLADALAADPGDAGDHRVRCAVVVRLPDRLVELAAHQARPARRRTPHTSRVTGARLTRTLRWPPRAPLRLLRNSRHRHPGHLLLPAHSGEVVYIAATSTGTECPHYESRDTHRAVCTGAH